jgi:hypothetical protein
MLIVLVGKQWLAHLCCERNRHGQKIKMCPFFGFMWMAQTHQATYPLVCNVIEPFQGTGICIANAVDQMMGEGKKVRSNYEKRH